MKRTTLIVVALLVAVCVVILKAEQRPALGEKAAADKTAAESVAPERWEYLAVAGPSTTNFTPTGNPDMRKSDAPFAREGFVLEQHLDKLGAKGWELVSVAGPPNDPVYYFKRRK